LPLKPVLFVANVGEEEMTHDKRSSQVQALFDYAARENNRCVRLGGKIEQEIARLNEDERDIFVREYHLREPGLMKLIHAAYDLLGYITFFTGNPNELRAWTLRQGATAWDAAGLVHTDFQKGFIKAEVMRYDDLERLGALQAVREAGLAAQEGKEYVVKDGEVIYFRAHA
jgi:ribosome-binding ATPase YchF (GTP1/OBG family)